MSSRLEGTAGSQARADKRQNTARRDAARRRAVRARTPFDVMLLGLITLLGGASFAMIRVAVETMPPAAVAVGRLWVGFFFLYGLMRLKGRRFPPFLVQTGNGLRVHRVWLSMIAVGIVGNTVPFFLFPLAQRHVESGLAGIYMAFMPLWTLFLAYAFASERLNAAKIAGFALGFAGVLVLIGPEVIGGAARSSVIAQAMLLLATFLYAVSAILARRAPPVRPRVFAAGFLLCAAVVATPSLLFVEFSPSTWSRDSLLGVIGLGLLPTGINGILIIMLIRRAGPSFMSLSNYMTPVVAVLLGAIIHHERLAPQAFLALVIILAGVFVSQHKRQATPPVAPGVVPPSLTREAGDARPRDQMKS